MTRAGTGKTYTAAFAMRELGFKRVLFLVHRNQIAKQAKASFERVFGSRIWTGLLSGVSHDYSADFVFATVQPLSKYDYPTFHLSMDCFWCTIVSGDLVLKEHEAAKWLTKEELSTVDWLPADITLVDTIRKNLI